MSGLAGGGSRGAWWLRMCVCFSISLRVHARVGVCVPKFYCVRASVYLSICGVCVCARARARATCLDMCGTAGGYSAYLRAPLIGRCRRRCRQRSSRRSQRCCRGRHRLRTQGSHEDAAAAAARGSLRTSLRMQTVLPFSPMACRQAPRLPATLSRAGTSWTRLLEVLGVLEVLRDNVRISPAL